MFRNHLVDQDWTAKKTREGTFVLDNNVSTPLSSTPTHSRSSSAKLRTTSGMSCGEDDSGCEDSFRSKSEAMNGSYNDHNGHTYSESDNGLANIAEITSVIAQVEESLSPLARASSQIRESVNSLERHLLSLKISSGCSIQNGH